MVQVLLDAGDDPTRGLTAAIVGNRGDIVRLLLASGATRNLNLQNGEALVTACQNDHVEMMKMLSAPNRLTNSLMDSIARGTSESRVRNHSSEMVELPG